MCQRNTSHFINLRFPRAGSRISGNGSGAVGLVSLHFSTTTPSLPSAFPPHFSFFTLAWNAKRGVDPLSTNYAPRLISNSPRIERYCLQSTQIPGTRRCLYTLVFGLAARFFALSRVCVYFGILPRVINDEFLENIYIHKYIYLAICCVAYLLDIRVCSLLFVELFLSRISLHWKIWLCICVFKFFPRDAWLVQI